MLEAVPCCLKEERGPDNGLSEMAEGGRECLDDQTFFFFFSVLDRKALRMKTQKISTVDR